MRGRADRLAVGGVRERVFFVIKLHVLMQHFVRNTRVHLRSLGAPVATGHPEATQVVLDVKNFPFSTVPLGLHAGHRTGIMDVQIYGPYIAWKVPHHGERTTYALEVWDWKKGILLWVSSSLSFEF